MAKREFQTVPDELLPAARAALAHLEGLGYRVRIEHVDIDHPGAAQMVARRQQTTLLVLVDKQVPKLKIDAWCGYAKSSGRDTRVVLVTAELISDDEREFLRTRHVGHLCKREHGIVEELQSADLAMNVVLPPLEAEPRDVRVLLGSTYDHFQRGQWREGFDEACEVLEYEARKYFARWQKTGRIVVVHKGTATAIPLRKLNKLPIGPLIEEFAAIKSKNTTDSLIEKALRQIKKDRNDRRHRRNQPKTEKQLRTNVGRHMYTILSALRAIHK
jgi:hypothetical protein